MSHRIAGIDRNTCQPKCLEVIFKCENVLNTELIAEDSIEMINKRDLLIIVGSELLNSTLEQWIGDFYQSQRPHPTLLTLTGSLVEGGACQ